jgi:hypothetical protein
MEAVKRIVPEKKAPETLEVRFSSHSFSTHVTCNGGKGQVTLESYNKWTAKYKGLCAGGCGTTRYVEVPMAQIS